MSERLHAMGARRGAQRRVGSGPQYAGPTMTPCRVGTCFGFTSTVDASIRALRS